MGRVSALSGQCEESEQDLGFCSQATPGPEVGQWWEQAMGPRPCLGFSHGGRAQTPPWPAL